MKTVMQIVKEYLTANGYDGLCHGDPACGCGLDDFMPCADDGTWPGNCSPARRVPCNQDNCPNPDFCPAYGDSEHNRFCFSPADQCEPPTTAKPAAMVPTKPPPKCPECGATLMTVICSVPPDVFGPPAQDHKPQCNKCPACDYRTPWA